jgi:homoserine/homoserine lactone efflux protein
LWLDQGPVEKMRWTTRARDGNVSLDQRGLMSTTVLLAFIATSVLLAVTPGPNMSLIIANTLSGGMRAGYITLAGTGTGLAILAGTAAIGMSSVMTLMADWFEVVRWAGALYLVVLGVLQVRSFLRRRGDATYAPPEVSARNAYLQGFLVALSNPKVLLFLGAFFPQFLDAAHPPGPQLAILATTFVVTLLTVDAGYTYAIGRARAAFDLKRLAVMDGIAGALLICGGLVLATARRP